MKINKISLAFLFSTIMLTAGAQTIATIQKTDSVQKEYHFSGTASVTNNGISFIPTFSIGKPATIVTLSMGSKKFSFEPEFRASLEGKPWSVILWGRYKLVNTNKFKFNIGAHPAISFKTILTAVDGKNMEVIQGQRFLAGEISPNFVINKYITVGAYYLVSKGFEGNSSKSNNFITLNTSISNINLSNGVFLRFAPQVYYLKMDANDGYYASSTISISKTNSPFSINSLMNKVIRTNIAGSKDFSWNISLIYSFYKHVTIKN
jgi:hypothetical protein